MHDALKCLDPEFLHIRTQVGNEKIEINGVCEQVFAVAELESGKRLHQKGGCWWIQKAPFYCMPLNEFQSYAVGVIQPSLMRSWLGYSHRIDTPVDHGYSLRWNIIDGSDLENFTIATLPSRRRSYVRQGIRNCQINIVKDIEPYLSQLRDINIVQAKRFEAMGDHSRSFLPASYYVVHEKEWAKNLKRHFQHPAHTLITASLDDQVVAYVDLIQLEETWLFGAVKSHDDFMNQRPVDALYYYILSCASINPGCKRVVNGGGWERDGLIQFKSQFLMTSRHLHYNTHSFIPRAWIEPAKKLFNRL